VDYALASPVRRVTLSFYDASGRLVRRYASDDTAPPPIPHLDKPPYWERPFAALPAGAGMHRFVWDLREAPPRTLAPDLPISAVPHDTPRVPEGPLVVPGRYTVRLEVDGKTQTRMLKVNMDPRVAIPAAALEQQYQLARQLTALMDRSYARGDGALNGRAAFLFDTIEGADTAPTAQAVEAVRALVGAKEARP
jgi:hypothetical protein